MNNLEDYLLLIEEEIDNGKPVHFTKKTAIDKNYILDVIVDIRSNIPDEINRAKKIIEDYDKIIAEAQLNAEKIIEEAEKKAKNMVNEHEIYKKAVTQADERLEEAKRQAESWSIESVRFVDDVLENTSNALNATIEKIEKSQQESINYFNELNELIYNNRKELRK